MSGRPLDWSAVGWDRDPTPGDPDAVAELAARFRRTAEAVRTAADGLKSIRSSDSYKGEGGEELRERTRDLAGKVREVKERYAEAADALDAYQREQYAAQLLADAALWRAQSAQSQQFSASSTLTQLPDPPSDGTAEDFQVTMARSAAQRADSEAKDTIARAQDDVRRAHEAHQEAGRSAARKLKDVIADDGLSDSHWDDVKGNAIAVVKGLAKVMDVIATVAGVLALVLAWVPVVGQVLALVALVATAISFVAHLTLLVTGNEGFTETLLAAFALLTFGLGRVATAGGRAAVRLSRVRARNLAKTRWKPSGGASRPGQGIESKGAQADRLIGGKLSKAERDLGSQMRNRPVSKIRAAGRESLSRQAMQRDFAANRKNFWVAVRDGRMSTANWRQEVFTPWRPTFDPLKQIDPSLLKAGEVDVVAAQARRYRLMAQGSALGDRVNTGYGAYVYVRGDDEAEKERQQMADTTERAIADSGFQRHIVAVDQDRDDVPVGPPYVDASARP